MIEERIEKIEERNLRVEADKAWEVSCMRRFTVAVFTFFIATTWLYVIDNTHPFLNAVVPTGGYLLSTISLPIVRKVWLRNKCK